MKRRINIWSSLDKVTVLLYMALAVMGWFNIYAAVYNEEHAGIFDLSQRYGKQFMWIIVAIVTGVFILVIDNRFYLFFARPIYIIILAMLVLVLIVGTETAGAKSWFEFKWFSLQPSEFAKFGAALALAGYMNSKRHNLTRWTELVPATGIILLPAVLTAMQPDMGSTVVFLALFIPLFREGMSPYMFLSGFLALTLFFLTLLVNNFYLSLGLTAVALLVAWAATRRWKPVLSAAGILLLTGGTLFALNHYLFKYFSNEITVLIAVLVSGIVFAWYFYMRKAMASLTIYLFLTGSLLFMNSVDYAFDNMLREHHRDRINILLGKKSDPHGTEYNVNQSLISIGSGGLTGKGYLQGTQTKYKFVPKQSSDFIFCTIGEEWGFLGAVSVMGLYLFLLLRLVFLAERQRFVFSRVFGYCVASVFFVHVFINIGMAIGIVPVIGIPLPFFSYGGSSLWSFTIMLFVFLRLDAGRNEYLV
ncbi:MAG: rod shape-determining protein RodA [Bacteroidales bacterium]|nr:rod shape-determining protein RodA [Bacteroidales bacterium]